ncbi:hypothetical protein SCHPADRAFT_910067 [Schizopora paradoxa]|uniref:Uncharacterized protein n=1 Tax=Schizopora paradoxa TaxID=27342 RepID=A0A0H2RPK2_9AGAM|nr:hypothetical protein SCHPADRAFT_910067 [Schizopora paradoxa]
MPVPLPALELVLEEIHLQRRASLRAWQELRVNVDKRRHGESFPDDAGKTLGYLRRVHSSWTSIASQTLGRILILQDINGRIVTSAESSPIFGVWTYEVYLSFSSFSYMYLRSSEFSDFLGQFWNSVEGLFSRVPRITTFCLQSTPVRTSSSIIDVVARKLSGTLGMFRELRSLRLYSDQNDTIQDVRELPTLFRALENAPHFENLILRNYLPCFALARMDTLGHIGDPDYTPDPHILSEVVGATPPLASRIHSLANLIRAICNTPIVVTSSYALSVGYCLTFASFKFDPARKLFTIDAARLGTTTEFPGPDIRPPTFQSPKWCDEMKILNIYSTYDIMKCLSPYPSLKFLRAFLTSVKPSADAMRDELRWFLGSLPSTLEVLDINLYWEVESGKRILSPGFHDEVVDLLAAIPVRCRELKVLFVKLDGVSGRFRTENLLTRLIDACTSREVPLVLHSDEHKERYGYNDSDELDRISKFETHFL